MAKNKTSRQWVHDHINDPYVKQAQAQGYRSRAAFKLLQIDERVARQSFPESFEDVFEV